MKVRTNSTLNDTSKDNSSTFKCKIPLFDDAESEWETDEEWGLRLASPSPSSIATAVLNPASTSPVIPSASVEVALSDEEDYSFMMTDPWISHRQSDSPCRPSLVQDHILYSQKVNE